MIMIYRYVYILLYPYENIYFYTVFGSLDSDRDMIE